MSLPAWVVQVIEELSIGDVEAIVPKLVVSQGWPGSVRENDDDRFRPAIHVFKRVKFVDCCSKFLKITCSLLSSYNAVQIRPRSCSNAFSARPAAAAAAGS